jgi:hypothetical protein
MALAGSSKNIDKQLQAKTKADKADWRTDHSLCATAFSKNTDYVNTIVLWILYGRRNI